MAKRSGRWYNKNEKIIMSKLGLKGTVASGAGWIEKEDGENDYVLAQLKSTDAESITIKMLDWRKLVYHANVSNKIPVFINEKIGEEVFITVRPADLQKIAKYLNGELIEKEDNSLVTNVIKAKTPTRAKKKIKSGNRQAFWEEREKSFKNKK